MRRGLVSLALLVSSGAGALACEPDALLHPVRLSPDRSARDYLPQPPRPGLILYPQAPAPSPLGAPPPPDLTFEPVESTAPVGAGFVQATVIQVDVLTLAVLNRLSSRMVFGITAYDADGDDPTESPEPDQESDVRFEGADDIESNQRGKTLNAADGRLSGDLTLAVGTRGGNASFSDVMAGTATVLDMNPFRDVAAQFDILIRNKVVNPYGFDALILRLRAAYLGAFSAINSDATSDDASASEFSVSLGVAW